MGWKAVKEYYKIKHIVQVTGQGICIGSPYVHNLIVIGLDGSILKRHDFAFNEDLCRYQAEMDANPGTLKSLVQQEDEFGETISVYTYDNGEILEKRCEVPGHPNLTTDGLLMYNNTFSMDRSQVIQWAIADLEHAINRYARLITEKSRDLCELTDKLNNALNRLSNLKGD